MSHDGVPQVEVIAHHPVKPGHAAGVPARFRGLLLEPGFGPGLRRDFELKPDQVKAPLRISGGVSAATWRTPTAARTVEVSAVVLLHKPPLSRPNVGGPPPPQPGRNNEDVWTE